MMPQYVFGIGQDDVRNVSSRVTDGMLNVSNGIHAQVSFAAGVKTISLNYGILDKVDV